MSNNIVITKREKWVRSPDGVLGGVFEGLGKSFGINPNLLRVLYLVSVFGFGVGFVLYPLCWFFLPRQDELNNFYRKKLFGVCLNLSKKLNIELGLLRVLFVVSFFASVGITLLLYIILAFTLSDQS